MAAKQVSAEDTRKLRDLNAEVKQHLDNGDYGDLSDPDLNIPQEDREEMRETGSRRAVRKLTEHVDKLTS